MKHVLYLFTILLLLPAAAMALDIEAVVCSGIEERMPVGEGDQFRADVERVYFWTRVTGAEGETFIRHVWLHEGQEIADVQLPVKGSPWRTYSYKTMIPEWTGNWEVKVVGDDGNVLLTKTFTIGEKAAMKESEPAGEKKMIEESPKASGGQTEPAMPADSTKPKATTPR
ncbi:MAG: DUF2914 domain-containing protein [Candidatus Zixiibacteriota bacterium]